MNTEKKWIKESEVRLGNCKDILPEYYGGQVSLIFTSPPYFNQRDCATGGKREDGTYQTIEEYFEDMGKILDECIRLSKPGAIFAVNIGSDPTFDLPSWLSMTLEAKGLKYIDRIAWVKGTGNITRGFHIEAKNHYYPYIVWEPIYIYQRSRAAGFGEDVGFPRFEERFKSMVGSVLRTNVWNIPQDNEATWHPAPFPRKLAYNIIACYTEPGDIILDPFGGAMTTAVAAEQINNRKYLICELKEEFYDKGYERIRRERDSTPSLF